MKRDEFWKLMEYIDNEKLEKGNYISANSLLMVHLEFFSLHELKSFQDHLVDLVYELDDREYMKNTGDFKEDPEAFLNFRLYVVARGEDYYNEVIKDPTKMPKNSNQQNEGLIVIAEDVWYNEHREDWKYITKKNYETYSNQEKWKKKNG